MTTKKRRPANARPAEKGTEGLKFNPSVPFSAGLVFCALLIGWLLLQGRTPEPELTAPDITEFLQTIVPEQFVERTESAPAPPEPTREQEPELMVVDIPVPVIVEVEQPLADSGPVLVIILDDIGNNLEAGMRAVNLPGAVTLAVLPYTPHGQRLAEAGHIAGKEIMLHAPMSNLGGMDLGPEGLTLDLDEETMTQRLRKAIADIPHIRGVNNHTGSELTAAAEPMLWVMQELSNHNLYFVDSMTTSQSVAASTAKAHGIPTLKRHVFLDNVAEVEAIATQFEAALHIARRDGLAVAIGHPYPATLEFLEEALPSLAQRGITLKAVSAVLAGL